MFCPERQQKIMQILEKDKCVTVRKLSKLLYISESTIRRDLTQLEESGKLRRSFGGAVLAEDADHDVPLLYRQAQNRTAKLAIAKKSVKFIHNGDIIFMDASTTSMQLVPFLKDFSNLTVITNSPLASVALGENKIKNYCTGGQLLNNSVAFIGGMAADFVTRFYADLFFFSCRGVSKDNILTDSSGEELYIKRKMMENSDKKIFLCDSSKFGLTFMHKFCDIKDIDVVLTEDDENILNNNNKPMTEEASLRVGKK